MLGAGTWLRGSRGMGKTLFLQLVSECGFYL